MAKRTKQEIADWRDKMKTLSAKIKAMPETDKAELFAKLGTITAEGRALSLHNTIMLYYQAGRRLSQVGGFKQWIRVGRQVKKGEHAAGSILVPISGTDDDDDLHFISVSVFDIEQTEEQAELCE